MNHTLPFILDVAAIAVSVMVVRFAIAFAKRLEARPPVVAPPDPAVGELREQLDAMQERLDFLERALVTRGNPGRALPAKGD